MRRKLLQIGASLAVRLPAEVVQAFRLKKGMTVDVAVHPQTGAVIVRPGTNHFENGKTTKRFNRLAGAAAHRYAESFRKLAK